jgi:predicted TIM-barrel fold metal-dependent hydrolase
MTTTTYADRKIWDADSHLMETPDWLSGYADPGVRERLRPMPSVDQHALDHLPRGSGGAEVAVRRRTDPTLVAAAETALMGAREWDALGSTDGIERRRALDLLGFEKQLVFSTFAIPQFDFDEADGDLLYGGTTAHNRGIAEFCSSDDRLIGVGSIPLADPERDLVALEEALDLGCGAILIPKENRGPQSPTHPAFDPIWARLEEANIPFMVHVGLGSDGRHFHRPFYDNGRNAGADFTIEGETIFSKDFMSLHYSARTLLSVMAIDGLFERFPRLRGACVEFGALWVVTWLQQLDWTQRVFKRSEPDLDLPLSLSDYIRRAVRFTPYSGEPVGWMIEQAGADLFMFSTDYPHPEGGRDPLRRFKESLTSVDAPAAEDFYWRNFAYVLGIDAGS